MMNGRNILIAGSIFGLCFWVGLVTLIRWLIALTAWVFS